MSRGLNWSRDQVNDVLHKRQTAQAPKPSKYHNQRVVINGEKFDSKREAAYYQELLLREKAGQIRNIQRQMTFHLCCPQMDENFKQPESPIVHYVAAYLADFTYEERDGFTPPVIWRKVVADVKGAKNTQMFALKKKWLELQHGIVIREVR